MSEQDPSEVVKKPATGVKKTSSFKAESETQTAVAVRVPSLKKQQQPAESDARMAAEKLVTPEQAQSAAMARRRRIMVKNRAQSVRTREKTPEATKGSYPMQDDTTTTDEEDVRSPRSPTSPVTPRTLMASKSLMSSKSPTSPTAPKSTTSPMSKPPSTPTSPAPSSTSQEPDADSDDVYAEMRKKLQEKHKDEKDQDDIDIDKIREAQAEEAKERRRRSISPFALPTAEEIANLQRKGSFIDPNNKLLSTVPNYGLCLKDDSDPLSRKNSLILNEADMEAVRAKLNISSNLTTPEKPNNQLITPPSPRKPQEPKNPIADKPMQKPKVVEKTPQSAPATKLTNTSQPKSCIKAPTNVTDPHPTSPSGAMYVPKDPAEVPPIRPKRSKSGTRSQGRTSESEMSEDQNTLKVQPIPQKAPKPKERRRTIATAKRHIPDRSPNAQRSKSATRVEEKLDVTGVEITKTSSEIIELLQKARNRSEPMPDEDERISSAVKAYVDRSRQLMTPTKFPATPRRGSGISCPKTIEIISGEEIIDSFKQAQRRSMEIERSRRSSGYIDASQSELTSSCYSSSNSEDESDFDLAKKTAELNRKLAMLHSDKEPNSKAAPSKSKPKSEETSKDAKSELNGKKSEKEKKPAKTIDIKPITIKDLKDFKNSDFKWMRQNCRRMWKEFKAENVEQCQRIRYLRNRCFSDMIILILFCGMGGFIFRYTEGAFENFYKCGVKRVKRDFIDSLWQTSHNLREDDWKSTARKKLWEFETQLHTAHEAGVHSYSGQKSWSFMNSVVYCLTVVTTIGYGHIAPSTKTGRAITIVYAIIGIPLFLILLADFGKLFTRCIKYVWAFVRRLYYTGSCRKVRRTVPVQEVMKGLNMVYEAASTLRRPSQFALDEEIDPEKPPTLPPKSKSLSPNTLTVTHPGDKQEQEDIADDPAAQTPAPSAIEIDDEFNLPISLAITVLLIYIIVGASIYVVWEDWGFFDSFYFVFISMSTIGFGDFVPNHPMYMMGSIVYLVFGMALTSMCINVVQVKLSDSFRQASAKIGATIGLKVAEEDGSLAAITPPPVEIPAIHNAPPKTPESGDATQTSK